MTIQVLTQCRDHLIERTYDAIRGAKQAIVHFYNSTSVLQRRVVFGLDQDGIVDIALQGARLCRKLEETIPDTTVYYEYSPGVLHRHRARVRGRGSATRSLEVIDPTPDHKMIINLPATVEMATPNVYADSIEWMVRHLEPPRVHRRCRCTRTTTAAPGVAAAELGYLAGADRIEGCLFGNGERTGNVCLVTLGMNLFSQGIDPQIDFSDIDEIRRTVEYCNQLPVRRAAPLRRRPRLHRLLRLAPGRDQEGLRGDGRRRRGGRQADRRPRLGRALPADRPARPRPLLRGRRPRQQPVRQGRRRLHPQDRAPAGPAAPAADRVQRCRPGAAPTRGRRGLAGRAVGRVPATSTCRPDGAARRRGAASAWSACARTAPSTAPTTIVGDAADRGERSSLEGTGNGPIAAFVDALPRSDVDVRVLDYAEHALSAGGDARAAAYVECAVGERVLWGVGLDPNIVIASLKAVMSAVNRAERG